MNSNDLRIRILLTLQNALLGEVSQSLRGVACSWNSQSINIYAIFDGTISDGDRESMGFVETEIISSCSEHQVNLECKQIDYPKSISLEDTSATWVYLRKEDSNT